MCAKLPNIKRDSRIRNSDSSVKDTGSTIENSDPSVKTLTAEIGEQGNAKEIQMNVKVFNVQGLTKTRIAELENLVSD